MFFCRTCNTQFTCKRNLKQHYQTKKHKKELQKKYHTVKCYCGKSFQYQKNYQRHLLKCQSQPSFFQLYFDPILDCEDLKVFNLIIQEISNRQIINQTKNFIIITNFPSQKLLKAKVLNQITQS